jgi:dTDP-4-dehydrorhamnose reductase
MNKGNIILISGGSGLLGSYLLKLNPNVIAPSHSKMDILNIGSVNDFIKQFQPHVFIHCAALISPPRCDKDPIGTMCTNIVGTCNVVEACTKNSVRLVYISTDYVFKGDKGYYSEEDEVLPQNFYAWSKLGGECAVRAHQNSLIVRTSFCPEIFPYEKAYVDQYTSRDSVTIIAPIILKLALNKDVKGVIHVGTKRKTVKELAIHLGKTDVNDLTRAEIYPNPPADTSFKLTKLKGIIRE